MNLFSATGNDQSSFIRSNCLISCWKKMGVCAGVNFLSAKKYAIYILCPMPISSAVVDITIRMFCRFWLRWKNMIIRMHQAHVPPHHTMKTLPTFIFCTPKPIEAAPCSRKMSTRHSWLELLQWWAMLDLGFQSIALLSSWVMKEEHILPKFLMLILAQRHRQRILFNILIAILFPTTNRF